MITSNGCMRGVCRLLVDGLYLINRSVRTKLGEVNVCVRPLGLNTLIQLREIHYPLSERVSLAIVIRRKNPRHLLKWLSQTISARVHLTPSNGCCRFSPSLCSLRPSCRVLLANTGSYYTVIHSCFPFTISCDRLN